MPHILYTLIYAPHFVRAVKRLTPALQEDVYDKITQFTDSRTHERLRVHALKGKMKGLHSFSVNYRVRVVVRFTKNTCEVYVLDVGDHSVYE